MSEITQRETHYPAPQTIPELRRLRAQHDLAKYAFGGRLILCPLDTTRSDLQILDSGAADGYWLNDLLQSGELSHPESATLVGTDIAENPRDFELPDNVTVALQNVLEPWPEEWKARFDLVHQRLVLSATGGPEKAKEVVKGLMGNAKRGGWVQLVDCIVPSSAIEPDDQPSVKMFKMLGVFMKKWGLWTEMGTELRGLLEAAGLEDIDTKEVVDMWGNDADMVETAYVELRGLTDMVSGVMQNMPDAPINEEEWKQVMVDVLQQLKTEGVEMKWFAAWGRVP